MQATCVGTLVRMQGWELSLACVGRANDWFLAWTDAGLCWAGDPVQLGETYIVDVGEGLDVQGLELA